MSAIPDDQAAAWENGTPRCPACGARIRLVIRTWSDFDGPHEEHAGECSGCDRNFPAHVMLALNGLTR